MTPLRLGLFSLSDAVSVVERSGTCPTLAYPGVRARLGGQDGGEGWGLRFLVGCLMRF